MRTFKELQDSVLAWMADSNDTGLMRELVSDAINGHHQQILLEERYDFMLWPKAETLSLVAGTTKYPLHPRFSQPLYFYDSAIEDYLEEVTPSGLLEASAVVTGGTFSNQFMLTVVSKFKAQPPAASTITVTTTGGTESASNSIIIRGVDSNGNYVEETLSSGGAWSTLTSSTQFDVIEDIVKTGNTWTRTITITDTTSSTTLLALLAGEFGKNYRMFETIGEPGSTSTVSYRFYKSPRRMVEDNDIPDMPEEYDEILVLHTLLSMQGYSRATPDEQDRWKKRLVLLENAMKMTYQQTRSIGGRPTYTRYMPRA